MRRRASQSSTANAAAGDLFSERAQTINRSFSGGIGSGSGQLGCNFTPAEPTEPARS